MATKKTIKPIEFTVDITDAECGRDVYYAFACAKIDRTLSSDEAYAYDSENDEFEDVVVETLKEIAEQLKSDLAEAKKMLEPKKKPNVFVRLWNWITGK